MQAWHLACHKGAERAAGQPHCTVTKSGPQGAMGRQQRQVAAAGGSLAAAPAPNPGLGRPCGAAHLSADSSGTAEKARRAAGSRSQAALPPQAAAAAAVEAAASAATPPRPPAAAGSRAACCAAARERARSICVGRRLQRRVGVQRLGLDRSQRKDPLRDASAWRACCALLAACGRSIEAVQAFGRSADSRGIAGRAAERRARSRPALVHSRLPQHPLRVIRRALVIAGSLGAPEWHGSRAAAASPAPVGLLGRSRRCQPAAGMPRTASNPVGGRKCPPLHRAASRRRCCSLYHPAPAAPAPCRPPPTPGLPLAL